MPAKVVNDYACKPDKRGARESIAGNPALVGAGLPAKVVNDNACKPDKRGVLESIAGKPAPTGIALSVFPGIA